MLLLLEGTQTLKIKGLVVASSLSVISSLREQNHIDPTASVRVPLQLAPRLLLRSLITKKKTKTGAGIIIIGVTLIHM